MREAARSGSVGVEVESGTPTSDSTAGTQTLVRTSAGCDAFAALPERAYDNLLVVSTRNHPKKLQTRIDRRGHDPERVGVVPAVPAAADYDGDLWTTDPVSPDDLTGLGMRFSDAVRHVESGTGWVVIDALGVLLTYADADRVCRCFQTLTNRVRARNAHGVYCVNPDAIADETYERLRTMCDTERELG